MTQEAFKKYRVANNLHIITDGEAGMDYIYQRGKYTNSPRPDIILLDLNLPKKHGSKILNEVKADPKLRSIPVVILTTSDLDEDIMGSYCHNANAFITKPIEFDDFDDDADDRRLLDDVCQVAQSAYIPFTEVNHSKRRCDDVREAGERQEGTAHCWAFLRSLTCFSTSRSALANEASFSSFALLPPATQVVVHESLLLSM
ncbi:MAG: response regulator [Halobacteriota archaeon]